MHRWQDIVLAVGSLIFAFALLPSVFSKHKPAVWTSLLTASVMAVFSVTYASLSLWYTASTSTLATTLWFVLAIQKILQTKDKDDI